MLGIGRLWPRQIHGSLVVLLGDGRSGHTIIVTSLRDKQHVPPTEVQTHQQSVDSNVSHTSTWGGVVS